jgi:hypothetical protein
MQEYMLSGLYSYTLTVDLMQQTTSRHPPPPPGLTSRSSIPSPWFLRLHSSRSCWYSNWSCLSLRWALMSLVPPLWCGRIDRGRGEVRAGAQRGHKRVQTGVCRPPASIKQPCWHTVTGC